MDQFDKTCLKFYEFMRSPRMRVYNSVFAAIYCMIILSGGLLLFFTITSLGKNFFYPGSNVVNIHKVYFICISASVAGICWTQLINFFPWASWATINKKSVCYLSYQALKSYLYDAKTQVFFYVATLIGIIMIHAMVGFKIYHNLNFLNTANILVEYKCGALFLLSLLTEISFILWRIAVIYKISMIKLAFPEKNIYEDWDQIQKTIDNK